ncbi:MAG: hypothetical protein A2Y70_08955 [Candidatus Aminicenantes bacterium RBG_13_64_14]|nr:MAG: hypothetical protein A2Y70_08955 [Candidatus Aminicenantes bacterium RBG_13_64_14]
MAGLVCGGPAAGADKADLAKKQNSLNSEYSLAKDSNFYFVLDVLGRKLELRVRGMVLRSWPFQSLRFWGRPEFTGNVELVQKTALKAPKRIVLKPGGEAEKVEAAPAPAAKTPGTSANPGNPEAFDLEALELKDMPKKFSLDFDNGLHIQIKVKTAASGGLLGTIRDFWRWYVDLPLRNLFGPHTGTGLAELELTFDNDKDGQSIYWHFFEGIKGIIL